MLLEPVRAWRVAYAKAFRFVGLDVAAQQALSGAPVTVLHTIAGDGLAEERNARRSLRAKRALERFGAVLILDVGPCALGIDPAVLGILARSGISEGIDEPLARLALERLQHREPDSTTSFLNSLGIGCIFYDEIDVE